MDDITYELLKKLNLKNVELISLAEFENDKLREVKKDRTVVEYCWTCTSSLCFHMLQKPEVTNITYIDADTFFYSDPEPIFRGINRSSIAIVEHRFSPERSYLEKTAGKYNVNFIFFKKDENGLACVKWWTEVVIKWCYDRYEKGKFGDQVYLDEFPKRFNGVFVIPQKGAGLAPWNLSRYRITQKDSDIYVDDEKLIFYHFHNFQIVNENSFQRARRYYIPHDTGGIIYEPYIDQIKGVMNLVVKADKNFHYSFKKITSKEKVFDFLLSYNPSRKFILFLAKIKNKMLVLVK